MSMEQDINRLHNRHVARILDSLKEINIPQIAIDAVKREFSFYTNDIKQVLTSNKENNDRQSRES